MSRSSKTALACLVVGIVLLVPGCSGRAKRNVQKGSVAGHTYTNDRFGVSIEYPAGWHVMSEGGKEEVSEAGGELVAGKDPALKQTLKEGQKRSYHLLMASKHPIGAPVDNNPNLSLVAEDVSMAPQIQTGKDYLVAMRQLMSQSQVNMTWQAAPYEYPLAGETFYRQDAETTMAGKSIKQCYIVTIRNGYALGVILSWHDQRSYETMEKSIRTLKLK